MPSTYGMLVSAIGIALIWLGFSGWAGSRLSNEIVSPSPNGATPATPGGSGKSGLGGADGATWNDPSGNGDAAMNAEVRAAFLASHGGDEAAAAAAWAEEHARDIANAISGGGSGGGGGGAW